MTDIIAGDVETADDSPPQRHAADDGSAGAAGADLSTPARGGMSRRVKLLLIFLIALAVGLTLWYLVFPWLATKVPEQY